MATGSVYAISPDKFVTGEPVTLTVKYTIDIGGLGIFPGWYSLLKVTIDGIPYKRWDYHPSTKTTASVNISCGIMPAASVTAFVQLYAQTSYSPWQDEDNMTMVYQGSKTIGNSSVTPEIPTTTIPTIPTTPTTPSVPTTPTVPGENGGNGLNLPSWALPAGIALLSLILLLPDNRR